jgi:DNA modification methylase
VAQTTILLGDALAGLQQINSGAVQSCVTSPPYFALRDYDCDGQIGLEETPELYVERLVAIFREVHRVLSDDGTAFINISDTYAGRGTTLSDGLKRKDLIGIPWMLAFVLRSDGWYLRSEIIWAKPNPMPESVQDRPTRSHEKVFLLTKRPTYYYDAEAIMEPCVKGADGSSFTKGKTGVNQGEKVSKAERSNSSLRNARDVWTITPTPFAGAHFATMPTTLAERCIRAGSRPGDLILEPFMGAATTALSANRLDREAVGCELSAGYADISVARLAAAGYQADIFE